MIRRNIAPHRSSQRAVSAMAVPVSFPRAAYQACAFGAALLLAGCAAGSISGGGGPKLTTATPPTMEADGRTGAVSPIIKPTARVAMLLPLSAKGQAAHVAKGLKQAAELALFEANNPNFQIIFKDTKGTPEGARAAVTLAASEGVELILGPLYGNNVKAVSGVARQVGLPVIAFSNDRQMAGNGTYLLSFLVREEVDRVVSFAATQGKRRYAALVPENAYGKLVEQAFREAVARSGGQIAALERYATNANGMLEPSQRLFELAKNAADAGSPIDAIFLPGGPNTLPNLGPLVKYANLDTSQVKFLGSGGWDYPNIGRDAAFIGGWYPAPDPRGWQSFSEKFARTFGSSPPRIATLAYDAVTIAVSLATSYPKGQRYTSANLTRPTGYAGLDGSVRFTSAGTAQRGLAILEVQKFGARVIDPGRVSFSSNATRPSSLAGPARPDSSAKTTAFRFRVPGFSR